MVWIESIEGYFRWSVSEGLHEYEWSIDDHIFTYLIYCPCDMDYFVGKMVKHKIWARMWIYVQEGQIDITKLRDIWIEITPK